eukprot:TRINITY_DN10045_c0_g1_i1.p1 TRINITY_DN10045_c0_g1~~TRINITY_DN10045_c0_g1_i1.p1  ORF type:complete len:259 (-),score=42.96 TRINITY_DN10045_c0_g1_i1:35-811(-)
MVLELNASDDRGIDVVRERIKDFASTKKLFSSGFKLVILDEADAMTNDAQAALRRVIEKHTRNVRFCMICNYINKISPALQSRCTRFRFAPLPQEQLLAKLNDVIVAEKVEATEDGKRALIRLSAGDMRKCLNILQSTFLSAGIVTEDSVYTCTGAPRPGDIKNIMHWMLNDNYREAYTKVNEVRLARGLALQDVVTEVHKYVLRMEFPNDMRIYLLDNLAQLEYRLASGASDKLQLGALLSIFQIVRNRTLAQVMAK